MAQNGNETNRAAPQTSDFSRNLSFAASNATSLRFLGQTQRPWMTGDIPPPGYTLPPSTRASNNTQPAHTRPPEVIGTSPNISHLLKPENMLPSPASMDGRSSVGYSTLYTAPSPNLSANAIPQTAALSASQSTQQAQIPGPSVGGSELNQKRSLAAAFPQAYETVQPPTAVPVPPPHQRGHPGTMQQPTPLGQLNQFIKTFKAVGPEGQKAMQRLALLQHAYNVDDVFYLCLHQIFCKTSQDPLYAVRIGFGIEQLRGFNILEAVLIPNVEIAPQAMQFFANFPIPDVVHASGVYAQVMPQVRAVLPCLGDRWPALRDISLARGYPPFSAELRAQLSLGSTVLQTVFFNSIHRQLGAMNGSAWSEEAMKIFMLNQQEHQERLKRFGLPPLPQEIVAESQNLGKYYWRLRLAGTIPNSGHESNSNHTNGGNPPTPTTATGNPAWPPPATTNMPAIVPPPVAFDAQHAADARTVRQSSRGTPQSAISSHGQHPQQNAPRPSIGNQLANQSPMPGHRVRPPTHTTSLASAGSIPVSGAVASSPVTQAPGGNQMPVRWTGPPMAGPGVPTPIPHQPLLPPSGQVLIQVLNPNTNLVALHQAHLRSPKFQLLNDHGGNHAERRYYQYLHSFALAPQHLGTQCSNFEWTFFLNDEQRKTLATYLVKPGKHGLETVRMVTAGTCIYRLRSVEASAPLDEAKWSVSGTSWPKVCFIMVNDARLEVRRKTHHGKDLSIDITKYLGQGKNKIQFSLFRADEEWTTKRYAVGVEIITVDTHDQALKRPRFVGRSDALTRITGGFQPRADGESIVANASPPSQQQMDSEIEVLDAHLSIDISDPFTTKPFNIPVRGTGCSHRECFDLETFLTSRPTRIKDKSEGWAPSVPDAWRCPICRQDARPLALVIDGFLTSVRDAQVKKGEWDETKAILVKQDGTWMAKLARDTAAGSERENEPENKRERGEGTEEADASGQAGMEAIELYD